MDYGTLYARLMDLAESLAVEIRVVAVPPPGGACRVRGRLVIMLSSEATLDEKAEVLGRALAGLPGLEQMFLLPEVREYLQSVLGRPAD